MNPVSTRRKAGFNSADDLRTAKTSGRLGLIYGFQDTTPLESDVSRVGPFRALGVRIIQLTYNKRNSVADGSLEPANAGLSDFGRAVIAELNRERVLIDLSHGGQRTIAEAIQASQTPVAITHTGCRALVDRPRNVYDEELRALADKGGVVGIYFMPFLRESGQPRAEEVVRHVEHALQVCGEDLVGIGTDGVIGEVPLTPQYKESHREFVEDRIRRGIVAPGEAVDVCNFVPECNRVASPLSPMTSLAEATRRVASRKSSAAISPDCSRKSGSCTNCRSAAELPNLARRSPPSQSAMGSALQVRLRSTFPGFAPV